MTQVEDQASQAEERSQETRSFVRQVRAATRRKYTPEEKIRIVLEGFRRETTVNDLCRREGIKPHSYYAWTKGFMEAGKERLTRDSVRDATRQEIEQLKRENSELKQLVGELSLELHRFKKTALPPLHDNGTGEVLMSRLREGRANTARGAAHFLRETVGRVRYGGARGQLTVRAGSGFYAHTVVAGCREMDVRFSITIRQRASLRDLIEAIPEEDWTPIPYWMDGAADVAETTCTPFQTKPDAAPVRLIVRRVKPTPGSQLALFARYSYHAFITDRDGETLELEADHRRHAEVENAIRDLKYGVGLNHMPSARFAANGAWLAVQVMAHNLARWTARIGLGERTVITKTLRRRVFALVGRITRSARRLTLHLPRRWPWETQFSRALARLQAIPLPA